MDKIAGILIPTPYTNATDTQDQRDAYREGYAEGRLAEREECAKMCEDLAQEYVEMGKSVRAGVADQCTAAIRARNET
jgi:hypothetical protein